VAEQLISNNHPQQQGAQKAAPVAQQPKAAPKPSPAPKPAGKHPVRPPAQTASMRIRHWFGLISFVVFVGLPSVGVGLYLWAVSVDQYASKVGFSVSREDTDSALGILSGLTSLSGSSSSDTDILYEFIQSQKLVADINDDIDLQKMWSAPTTDVVFALTSDASIEELVSYWNRMVRVSYGTGSGLIEVEALAFSAADATLITETLLKKSSDMINELSDIARLDGVRYAEEELHDALERLKEARTVVTRFRNENQIVNPEIDIQTQAGLLGNLQAQQAEALIEIDLLEGTVNATDPRMAQAMRRLVVIEKRINEERKKLGVGGAGTDGTAFADLLGKYESLVVDREFAEASYVSALATYDAALAESRRKTRYLAAYMEPTEAETPEYPKRKTMFALISMFLFLIWSVLILVGYSIRDRR
jgi:capsular polysaccharide transport system permease protein